MKKRIVFYLIITGMFSCAAPQYFHDYDRRADFSKFGTYSFFSEMQTGLSNLDEERVFAAIDSVLQSKGLQKSEEPDFKINVYASHYESPSRNRLGVGIGSGGGGLGVGVSGGIPIGGPEMFLNLTIEFVENPSDVLFWQSVAEARFNPNMQPAERSQYFRDLIAGVLGEYPPGD